MPKNTFFGLFSQKFACGAENFAKIGAKQFFGRARKINLVDLKKGRQNFRFFFENPPPLEKILDPPLIFPIIFLSAAFLFYATSSGVLSTVLITEYRFGFIISRFFVQQYGSIKKFGVNSNE